MKKRLRKKLGTGEFRELCFDVDCNLVEMDEAAEEKLFDAIIEVLEKHDMHCHGCLDERQLELSVCTGLIDTDNENRYEQAKQDLAKLEGLVDLKFSDLY